MTSFFYELFSELPGNTVPMSNDEDADNTIVRMVGDVKLEQKYRACLIPENENL